MISKEQKLSLQIPIRATTDRSQTQAWDAICESEIKESGCPTNCWRTTFSIK